MATDQALSTNTVMVKRIKVFKLNINYHCKSKYIDNCIEEDYFYFNMTVILLNEVIKILRCTMTVGIQFKIFHQLRHGLLR